MTGTRTNRGTVQRGRNYYDDCFPHQPILLISGNIKRCFPFLLFRPEKRVGHILVVLHSLKDQNPIRPARALPKKRCMQSAVAYLRRCPPIKKQSHELSSNRRLPQLDEDVHYQAKHEDLEITSVGIFEYL